MMAFRSLTIPTLFTVLAMVASSWMLNPLDAAEPLVVKQAIVTAAEKIAVPANVDGVLAEVNVREGQQVARGQMLAKVDDRQATLQVRRAEHAWRKAKHALANDLPVQLAEKQFELAEAQLQRLTGKVAKVGGAVSDAEIDRARLARDEARIRLEQAKHDMESRAIDVAASELELDAAKLAHQQTQILCSLGGEVAQVLKHSGEWVRQGDSVMELIRLDVMRVEWLLPADLALGDKLEGKAVRLLVTLHDEVQMFDGHVTYVHNDVSNLKGKVRVWAEVQNRDQRLRPGMKGEVRVELKP